MILKSIMKPLLTNFSIIWVACARLHTAGGFGTGMTTLKAAISMSHAAKPAGIVHLFQAFKSSGTECPVK